MNLKTVFIVVLVGVGLYSAGTVALPWFKNQLFQWDIEELIKEVGPSTLTAVRGRVEFSITSNGLPIPFDKLETSYDQSTGKVVIQTQYTVTVTTPLKLYTKTWSFHPYAERIVQVVPGSGALF